MKDLLLLRRIRMLSWLEPVHLDLALNLDNVEVQGMVSKGREGGCGYLRCEHFMMINRIVGNGFQESTSR